MYIGLQLLRAKIRGLQLEGASIHCRIRKARGPKRDALWREKRRLGCYSREHLIAYGLLRGISYERIERCAKENRPNVASVLALMKDHGAWLLDPGFTLKDVEAMMAQVPSKEPSSTSSPEGKPKGPTASLRWLLSKARGPLEKGPVQ